MIRIPKLSHMPFDTLIMGGVGYALGRLSRVNAKLSATIFAVASLANYILFSVVNRWGLPFLSREGKSPEAIYTGTNTFVSTVTIFAARHFDLISRNTVGIGLFASALVLAARLNMLSELRPSST